MHKRYSNILILCIVMFSYQRMFGQIAMPDTVCAGQTRHYSVDPNPVPGSTYTWMIDGVVQSGFTSNEFDYTWNIANTHLLEVQEHSANGCTGPVRSGQVFVYQYTPRVVGITQPTCSVSTGSVILNNLPETGIWTINPGTIRGTGTSSTLTSLATGLYNFTVTDASGCISLATETIEIGKPPQLIIKIERSVSIDGDYNINCAGANTGYITVEAINNSGPVEFLWTDGFTGNTRTNLAADNYEIIAIDSNNCQADSTVGIIEPELIKAAFKVTEPACPGSPAGEIRLSVTGGVPGDEYSFLWSDNSISQNISNITEGLYTVNVTDMNGCTIKDSVQVGYINQTCIVLPEAFSPNNDLINDYWIIGNIESYPDAEIMLYNRWGLLVWKSDRGYHNKWDGTSNGVLLPIDAYHYVIDFHNGTKPIAGVVTIVR